MNCEGAIGCAYQCSVAHFWQALKQPPHRVRDLHTDLPWLEESIQNGFKAVKIKLGAGDLETDVAVVSEV